MCFVALGVLVTYAEAGWLLEISFMDFFLIAVTLDRDRYLGCPKPVIWQAWCPHFNALAACLAVFLAA